MNLLSQKCLTPARWLVPCVLLCIASTVRAEMVATFIQPLYKGMVLEFQFSNLSSPRAMKGKSECESAGRMMVLVIAYDPNRPFNASPYASGCWHTAGSMIIANSKVSVNSAPLDLSIPVSKAVTKADFTGWSRYKIDPSRKNPPEKLIAAVEKKKAQLDISPETIAYTSSETMLGAIHAFQLQDKDTSSSHCPVQGPVKLALRTESTATGGTVTEKGTEVCWYIDAEDNVNINGYLASANNTFHQIVKKSDLTLTGVFTVWPKPAIRAQASDSQLRGKSGQSAEYDQL